MSEYLLKGDINGIQDFIYNVYEGEGGVAKILRARSFYISVLSDAISKYIRNFLSENWECEPILNGGGGFILKITPKHEPESKSFEQVLDNIRKDVESFLLKELKGEIGITLGYIKAGQDGGSNLYELNRCIDDEKKRKFRKSLSEPSAFIKGRDGVLFLEKPERNSQNKRCVVCRTFFERNKTVCGFCETLRRLGTVLPKFSKKEIGIDAETGKKSSEAFNMGRIGNHQLTLFLEQDDQNQEPLITVPLLKRDLTQEDIRKYQLSDELSELKSGMVAPFEVISLYSKGDNRLGYLTMDVDNLGLLFGKIQNMKLQRKLSRSLNNFFSKEVPKIARNDFKPDGEIGLLDETVIYILYSGGDDLFAIGPWDKVLDFASRVNSEFKRFVKRFVKSLSEDREISELLKKEMNKILLYQEGENKGLSLSAGFVAVRPKFTVRVAAEMCKEEEKRAKEGGKRSISAFGDVISWNVFPSIVKECNEKWIPYVDKEDKDDKEKKVRKEKIARGFFYKLYKLYLNMLTGERKNLMFYPLMHYSIARNIDDSEVRKEVAELVNNAESKKIRFICNYILTATRRRDER